MLHMWVKFSEENIFFNIKYVKKFEKKRVMSYSKWKKEECNSKSKGYANLGLFFLTIVKLNLN